MICWILPLLCQSKRYTPGQHIPVYANKVSPLHNPSETYDYYSLPFCPYFGSAKPSHSFSDALLGNRHKLTPIFLNFTVSIFEKTICKVNLTSANFNKFWNAIAKSYYYELVVDKLPLWGLVGSRSRSSNETFIFTHMSFIVSYNKTRIINITLESKNPFKMELGRIAKFAYSVEWTPTNRGKSARAERYRSDRFFDRSVRYYSLVLTICLVLVLVILTVFVLFRSLGNDLLRYRNEADVNSFELDFCPERGWKVVHADVFRPPPFSAFLSVLIGVGAHVSSAVLLLLLMLFFGSLLDRGTTVLIGFFCYSATALLGGYVAAALYKRWGGRHWIRQLVALSLAVPLPFFVTQIILSVVAMVYGSTQVVRLHSWVIVVVWYLTVVAPLTLFGGILGRNWFLVGPNPAKVGHIRRLIPSMPFYLSGPFVALAISWLGSASIFSEINYILVALWTYRMHYVWGFSIVVSLMLLIVVACSTVVVIYRRLTSENYLWHWISFIAPFCVAFFVLAYGCWYFVFRTEMAGLLQTLYYFAYTAILSCIIGVVCGFVGFAASALFVRRIYTNLKVD
jgi:transmembrane 9 superfamily protein 3